MIDLFPSNAANKFVLRNLVFPKEWFLFLLTALTPNLPPLTSYEDAISTFMPGYLVAIVFKICVCGVFASCTGLQLAQEAS